jgi:hypothetical protein
MRVYSYVCVFTVMYVCLQLCMRVYSYVCVFTVMYVSLQLCMCIYSYVCVFTVMYACVQLCMCLYSYVCVFTVMYVCLQFQCISVRFYMKNAVKCVSQLQYCVQYMCGANNYWRHVVQLVEALHTGHQFN